MKLGHIELFVSNPLNAKDFYVQVLGFRLIDIQAGKYVWIDGGNLSILLRSGDPPQNGSNYQSASAGLVLYTDNLDRTAAELRSRGLQFQGNDCSPRCLTFTDPDGHWFQLVNPSDH